MVRGGGRVVRCVVRGERGGGRVVRCVVRGERRGWGVVIMRSRDGQETCPCMGIGYQSLSLHSSEFALSFSLLSRFSGDQSLDVEGLKEFLKQVDTLPCKVPEADTLQVSTCAIECVVCI